MNNHLDVQHREKERDCKLSTLKILINFLFERGIDCREKKKELLLLFFVVRNWKLYGSFVRKNLLTAKFFVVVVDQHRFVEESVDRNKSKRNKREEIKELVSL